MKGIFLSLLLIAPALSVFSQDYMDKIAKASCECIQGIKDTTDVKTYTATLGVCLIKAAQPYKKQLQKDYSVNLDNIDSEVGNQLGRIVGAKMVTVCPETVIALSKRVNAKQEEEKEALTFTGVITKIENEPFVIFTMKDETGKLTKFYWLTFVKSPMELTGHYSSLSGKSVTVVYRSEDIFDPRLNEYRTFNILEAIEPE